MKIPVIETDRLRLRAHRLEDFNACKMLWADREVVRYISGETRPVEETWSRFLRYRGHWEMLGFGYWVLEELKTGAFLGEVGFANYKRDMQPSLNDCPESGWVLNSAAQGQGYGREAVKGILAWADRHLAADTTVCIIDPEHKASIKLALSCGYILLGSAKYKNGVTEVYERERKV